MCEYVCSSSLILYNNARPIYVLGYSHLGSYRHFFILQKVKQITILTTSMHQMTICNLKGLLIVINPQGITASSAFLFSCTMLYSIFYLSDLVSWRNVSWRLCLDHSMNCFQPQRAAVFTEKAPKHKYMHFPKLLNYSFKTQK